MSGRLHAALRARGLVLGPPPAPAGAYQPLRVIGVHGAVSGQFPFVDGRLAYSGRIGAELTEEQGRAAAELAAVNLLTQIQAGLGGLGRLQGLLRLDGYVASAPGWTGQPHVLDAASDLLIEALGPAGQHARTAIAVAHLPLNAPVELAATFIAAER